MNIIFRCLLTVYAFCVTLFSVFAMGLTLRVNAFKNFVFFWSDNVLTGERYTVTFFIIELIFFCVGVFFLLYCFRFNLSKRLITRNSELGEVIISYDTIESIVIASVKKLQQVKELKVYVQNRENNLIILVKLIALMETNIPVLVEEVQLRAKKAVEENTGLKVSEVQVLVDDVSSINKARVE